MSSLISSTSENPSIAIPVSLSSPSNDQPIRLSQTAQGSQSFWSKFNIQKLKSYGKWGIITHITLSWSILGLTYFIIKRSGQGDKIINFFKLQNRVPKQAGSFAVALLIYKAMIPARIALSMMVTPILVDKFHLNIEKPRELGTDKSQLLSQAGILGKVQKIIE